MEAKALPGNQTMARLVIGLGSSHSPMVVTDAPMWEQRTISDHSNPDLYDLEGNHCTYEELQRSGRTYVRECRVENLCKQAKKVQASMDRLAADLEDSQPDVVVIVGDDQHELFDASNQPAFSIFYGERATTHTYGDMRVGTSEFMKVMSEGYMMDRHRELSCDAPFASDLIGHLIRTGIDVGASAKLSDPETHGFGHAYGFVVKRLMANITAPIVPIMLNTYYPPNQPTPERCYAIGEALGGAIEASTLERRVAVVASGGLSHFVTNEPLDTRVLNALRSGDSAQLCEIPEKLLQAGSSEIRNWIMVAGVFKGKPVRWVNYVPVYRTPAGTGVGLGFARW
jgi:catalytic LigB subunit of aromatic ring-opening dioxygenase